MKNIQKLRLGSKLWMFVTMFCFTASSLTCQDAGNSDFASENKLMAWAFLDFDTEERTPPERAEMLNRAGFTKCGYEGHPRYIGQLEEHIIAYRDHGIELVGIYLEIRQENPLEQSSIRETIDILRRQDYKTQLWLTVNDALLREIPEEFRVEKVCELIKPVADKVFPMGCKIAMYNHGGWTGNPANQVQVIRSLRNYYDPESLGIVLNFHHAHPYIDQFSKFFSQVKPYLFVLNTNGMRIKRKQNGEIEPNPKILPLGEGDYEIGMLRIVKESGYRGLIGIIDHTKGVDPEVNLTNNREALEAIRKKL